MERGTLVKVVNGELKDLEGIVVHSYTVGGHNDVYVQFTVPVKNSCLGYGRNGYTAVFSVEELAILAMPETYEVFHYPDLNEARVYKDSKYSVATQYDVQNITMNHALQTAINALVLYMGTTTDAFRKNKLYRIKSGRFYDDMDIQHGVDELEELDRIMGFGKWLEVAE